MKLAWGEGKIFGWCALSGAFSLVFCLLFWKGTRDKGKGMSIQILTPYSLLTYPST